MKQCRNAENSRADVRSIASGCRDGADNAPATVRLSAAAASFGVLGLELDVVLNPDLLDEHKLSLDEVDGLFLAFQDLG